MVNIGVIGCGYWGPNLIRNFNELSDCCVRMAADLKPGRLKYIGSRYPHIQLTQNYRDLLDDPELDAVCVVTAVSSHYAIAKEAILAGKDVFVEKPMTYSVREAEELVELAQKHNKTLMAGHIFEYSPAVNKMKELITENEIGDIFYIDSSRVNLGPPASEVNAIWDLAPHDVSIILYLLGKEPVEVSAIGPSYVRPGLEEMAYITLKFPDHVLGHIHVSWLAPCKLRRTQVMASKKVILFDDTQSVEKVKVYSEGIDTRKTANNFGEFQLTYRAGDIFSPNLENLEPLRIECEHFVHCITNGQKPRTDGKDGLRVVKVLEAANLSMKNGGRPVEIR